MGGETLLQAYEDASSVVQFDTNGNRNLEPGTRSIQFQVTDTTALVSNVTQINLAVALVTEGITINVTSGDDIVAGAAGNHEIEGGSNADLIYGGSGGNSIFVESGHDLVNGGEGDDKIESGSGEEFLVGGDVGDVLTKGAEDDNLFGRAGNDTFKLEGDEYAHGGSSNDLFQVDTDDIADWNQGNSVAQNAVDVAEAAAANAADANEIDLNDVTNAGIYGGSGHEILQINASQDTTINLGEGNYEDMVDPINNIEAIDLIGGDGNITLGLASDDDNELDINLGDGDEVDLRDGDQPVEGTNDNGSTNFTYFDDGGNILAAINIRDDTDNTCT